MQKKVITNYKSLEYFITPKKLTRHQSCCEELLSRFNFIISHTVGKDNVKADVFTHHLNNNLVNNNNNQQQDLL